MSCVLLGKCHSSSLSFPQPETVSRRSDKEMTPLTLFGESNLVFALSSSCSLQYAFLSIGPGALGDGRGVIQTALSVSKELLTAEELICVAYLKAGWNA